jgi:hypothetical protein
MGKFSAAKLTGGADAKTQTAHNYLIDLLESGYVSNALIEGNRVRVDVNSQGGFTISSNDVIVGGIIPINGVIFNVAGALTNDATDPAFYATIGETTIGGAVLRGLFGYLPAVSTTVPVFKIVSREGSVSILPTYGRSCEICDRDASAQSHYFASFGVAGGTGYVTIGAQNANSNNMGLMGIDFTRTEISFGSKSVGCDATGAYYSDDGETKIYFKNM